VIFNQATQQTSQIDGDMIEFDIPKIDQAGQPIAFIKQMIVPNIAKAHL
jgi:hypothetical protein